jgi:hypothetical protein
MRYRSYALALRQFPEQEIQSQTGRGKIESQSASAIFDLRQQNSKDKRQKTKELKIKNKNDDEPSPAAKPQSKVSRTTPMPEGDVLRGERRWLTGGVRSCAAPTPNRKLGESSEDGNGGQKAS